MPQAWLTQGCLEHSTNLQSSSIVIINCNLHPVHHSVSFFTDKHSRSHQEEHLYEHKLLVCSTMNKKRSLQTHAQAKSIHINKWDRPWNCCSHWVKNICNCKHHTHFLTEKMILIYQSYSDNRSKNYSTSDWSIIISCAHILAHMLAMKTLTILKAWHNIHRPQKDHRHQTQFAKMKKKKKL